MDYLAYAATENFRLARSKPINQPADGTYNCIQVPHWGFVKSLWLYIQTAYIGGTPTVTVGWAGNQETAQTAGLMSTNIAKPKEAGLKLAQRDNLLSFPGKWFLNGPGMITITIANNSATTKGFMYVLAEFSVIH